MHITVWRFAHNCLPCGQQLQVRHVPVTADCFFCGRYESIEHTLLFCCFAQEVWEIVSAEYPIELRRKYFTSTKTWTLDFLERCSPMQATVLMVTMWHIWDARNKIREGEPLMHPNSIAQKVLAYIQMIATHLYKTEPYNRRETIAIAPKWSPPPEGTVLINVDAAIFSSTRRMGIGAVIRDHTWNCLVACSEQSEEVVAPEIAEALAMRRAIILPKEEGFSKIIVNSDCLSVVKRVTSDQDDRSLCGPVIHDIRRLAQDFVSYSFRHVYRGLNIVAHSLAKFSEISLCSVWRGFTPECIREAICNDILII
jgi:hypothetical protein